MCCSNVGQNRAVGGSLNLPANRLAQGVNNRPWATLWQQHYHSHASNVGQSKYTCHLWTKHYSYWFYTIVATPILYFLELFAACNFCYFPGQIHWKFICHAVKMDFIIEIYWKRAQTVKLSCTEMICKLKTVIISCSENFMNYSTWLPGSIK